VTVPTYEQVGARIRQLRQSNGLTQAELGDRLGVSQASVSNWESGARLDHVLLSEIAEALGSTLPELLVAPTEGTEPANGDAP
jgi:transcriptional regulator with XRE-family HTH domain